jgi:hypothetical protein
MTALATHNATATAITHRVRTRARLLATWTSHLWASGQSSADQGLAITPGEVERILLDPVEAHSRHRLFSNTDEVKALAASAVAADNDLREDPFWNELITRFALSPEESDFLCLLIAVELESNLSRVIAYIQDDARALHPTPAISASLFENGSSLAFIAAALLRWRLAQPLDSGPTWSSSTPWQVDPAVGLSATLGVWVDPRLDGIAHLISIEQAQYRPCLYPQILDALIKSGPVRETALTGPEGSGRQTLAAQYAAYMGKPLLAIDTPKLLAVSPSLFIAAARTAYMLEAVPYWRDAEAVGASEWSQIYTLAGPILRGTRAASATAEAVFELTPLSTAERIVAWKSLTDAPVPDLVLTQRLTPAEIALTARSAHTNPEFMRASLRRARPVQTDLLEPLPCPYTWDDLVVSKKLTTALKDFEAQVRLRWEVYEEWGFHRLTHLGQGISALFGGPSGTGKTMAAQVLARSLGLDLYRVDLAGVVNKYIGETEKRLRDVFDACERSGTLLLFDEADALFGSRTQVKDSHDRFANIEIDYLLQRIERFDGIAILATNRKADLDKAFLRRLRFVIDFVPPGPAERLCLWHKALLPTSPSGETILGQIDFDTLARSIDLTGAQIKSIALGAAFMARSDVTRIEMHHIVASAERELAKHDLSLRGPLGKAQQL